MNSLPGMRWIAACFFLLLVTSTSAKTVDVPVEGFSIDIPDTLTVADRPGTVLSAADATNTSAISISVFPNSTNQKIQAPYIEGIQDSMQEQGKKAGATLTGILKEGPLTIGGASAYEISCVTMFPKGEQVYIHQYPIFANHKTYVVSIQTYDLRQESSLVAAAMSFRFSTPPELPDALDDPHLRIGVMLGQDISFTLPFDWFTQNVEGAFYAWEIDKTSQVSVTVLPANLGQIDPKAYQQKIKSTPPPVIGGQVVEFGDDGPISINNVPAWFLRSVETVGGVKKSYACSYVFLANQKAYSMAWYTTDPDKIPLVEKIALSMRIGAGMTAEQVRDYALAHEKNVAPNSATPGDNSGDAASYALGFRMGQITFYVLLAVAVVRGLFLIWRRLRR